MVGTIEWVYAYSEYDDPNVFPDLQSTSPVVNYEVLDDEAQGVEDYLWVNNKCSILLFNSYISGDRPKLTE